MLYSSLSRQQRSAVGCVGLCRYGLLLLAGLAAAAGCQTPHYRASTLPAELNAPPTTAHQINLASMSGIGSGTSRVGPGDLVEITIVSGGEEGGVEPLLARVDQTGNVNVPLVGEVPVAGLEPFEAAQRIAATSVETGIYRQPSVVVKVKEPAVNQVTVLGAVKEPGVKKLPRTASNVLNAVAAAGGFTEKASTNVEVMRPQPASFVASTAGGDGVVPASYNAPIFPVPQVDSQSGIVGTPPAPSTLTSYRLDLAQADRARTSDYRVGDGDVVMVLPDKPRTIHVSGLVNKPDQFEIPKDQDVYVLDAIAMAGGIKSPVADKVYVIRRPESVAAAAELPAAVPEPVVIEVSIAKAKRDGNENLRLAAGDMVSVEATALTNTLDALTTFFRLSFGFGGNFAFF